jgi:hypothetical protein
MKTNDQAQSRRVELAGHESWTLKRYAWRSGHFSSPVTGDTMRAVVGMDEQGRYRPGVRMNDLGRAHKSEQMITTKFDVKPVMDKGAAISKAREMLRSDLIDHARFAAEVTQKPGEIAEVRVQARALAIAEGRETGAYAERGASANGKPISRFAQRFVARKLEQLGTQANEGAGLYYELVAQNFTDSVDRLAAKAKRPDLREHILAEAGKQRAHEVAETMLDKHLGFAAPKLEPASYQDMRKSDQMSERLGAKVYTKAYRKYIKQSAAVGNSAAKKYGAGESVEREAPEQKRSR